MPPVEPSPFGVSLRQHRVDAGLTQEELAERALLSTRAISDLERGVNRSARIYTVRQLAEALGLIGEGLATFLAMARAQTESHAHAPQPEIMRSVAGDEPVGDAVLPIGGFLGALPTGILVAREDEVGRILALVDAVSSGEGRLALLAGEAGVGKTRLAQEVTLAVRDRGFLMAAGRCYEAQQSVPYYPFLEALTSAYEAAPPAVRSEVSHRWPYLGRLLPDQLGSSPSASPDSSEEQQRLFRAVTGFVQAIAQLVPVSLMLDDLHWADSASLELLQHLARHTRGNRVLLLGTYRDVEVNPQHALEAALRDLSREQLMERVAIRRLGSEGTAALIAEKIGEVEAGSEFAALVHRHTDGNPFFTQQVLRALVENGSLYRQNGRWERRAVREIEVPESVRSVIGQRVSRLLVQAQEILHEASVLGQALSFEDLQEMSARAEEDVDMALIGAAGLGLIRVTDRDDYVFDHALTQQALYEGLSPRRRKRLHLAAGEALEKLPKRKRDLRAAELGWHFLQGDDAERALPYTVLAGDQAEAVFAHGEAEQHYRMALELIQEIAPCDAEGAQSEAGVLDKLGVVLKITGRYDEALAMLEQAAHVYRDTEDSEGRGRAMAEIGLIYALRGRPEDGIVRLQPLVESLDQGTASHSLALLYAALVRLYNQAGWQSEQLVATQRLLELAHDLEDERLLAEAELHRGVSLMHTGQYKEALQALEAAIARSEGAGDLSTLCMALDFAGFLYHSLRRSDRALMYRERTLEVAERLGDPREISYRALEVAWMAFILGDWSQSRLYAERSLTVALSLDNLATYFQPLYTLGELSLYEGEWEHAAGYLHECDTIARHMKVAEMLREAQGMLAEMDLLRGDPQAALARLQPLLDGPTWGEDLNFLLRLAWTYLEMENVAGPAFAGVRLPAFAGVRLAEDTAAKAFAEATRQRVPVCQVEALRIQGMIATRREDWEKAEQSFRRAVEQAREITYPWGEARALYECGLLHAQKREAPQAREQLEGARLLFERLGSRPYIARVDEAVRDPGLRSEV
jgi:tetratricopeptide (TPR) repeat protein/transcriptional regulator with XRE-family HTH domain